MLSSQELGTLGFFLSLVSLLGSFFYVQLSNWLRDLIAAEARYDANAVGNGDEEKKARRELKYGIKGFYNPVPLITSGAVTAFITLVSGIIFTIISPALCKDYLARNLALALAGFLLIYVGLTGYLLTRGYAIGRKIDGGLKSG